MAWLSAISPNANPRIKPVISKKRWYYVNMDNSSSEINGATAILAILKPGKLPLDIFNQVARLTVTPVVEIVPFYRAENGALKVLLLQRSADDAFWAGMYHVPGAVVLATDAPGSFTDALQRILDSKLANYQITDLTLVDTQLCKVLRGTEVAIIYRANLKSAPDEAFLFDPEALPSNMIEGQADFIKAALKKLG